MPGYLLKSSTWESRLPWSWVSGPLSSLLKITISPRSSLKTMKTGPVDALKEVKMEDAEVVTPMSAEEVPVEEQADSVMEDTSMVDDDATKSA